MPRVRSDEIQDTSTDQPTQPIQQEQHQQTSHEHEKTPSPIGAGLPLITRLRMLKEKQVSWYYFLVWFFSFFSINQFYSIITLTYKIFKWFFAIFHMNFPFFVDFSFGILNFLDYSHIFMQFFHIRKWLSLHYACTQSIYYTRPLFLSATWHGDSMTMMHSYRRKWKQVSFIKFCFVFWMRKPLLISYSLHLI